MRTNEFYLPSRIILMVFLLIGFVPLTAAAFQIDKILTPTMNQNNNLTNDDEAARRLIAAQPDYTANVACSNYENEFGHGFEESVKSWKKGDWYRHESEKFIDYFTPDAPPVRYSLKTKRYDAFLGDAENHLWFTQIESPALLAKDKTLRFEIIKTEKNDLKIGAKSEKPELIKIKVTGETNVGGDWDKATAFLYVAPDSKNLVVKTELIFPKGGRICTLQNISFVVPDGVFTEFTDYRRRSQIEKHLALPKAADVAKVEFNNSSNDLSFYFTEKSLLESLPRFVPGEGYKTKWILYQTGTMTLTDGTILHWSANDKNSLMLKYGIQERYYVLPSDK